MANGLNFPEPEFTLLPTDWEKHIGRNSSMIAAFHEHKPGLLEAYPKQRAKASGPWPSIRSWTNAAICAAALEAIDAEPLLRYQAIAGCVGEEAMLEFQDWESKLDLPSPEDWIAKAVDARAAGAPLVLDIPPRSDQVMAVLGALTDRVKNYQLGPQWQAHGGALAGRRGLLRRGGQDLGGVGRQCRRAAVRLRARCVGLAQGPHGVQQSGVGDPPQPDGSLTCRGGVQ